jgi:hypothetical protein
MPEWVSVPKAAGLLEGTMMALSIHGKPAHAAARIKRLT